jgi:hypothetical protein
MMPTITYNPNKEFSKETLTPLLKKLAQLNYRIIYDNLTTKDIDLIRTIKMICRTHFKDDFEIKDLDGGEEGQPPPYSGFNLNADSRKDQDSQNTNNSNTDKKGEIGDKEEDTRVTKRRKLNGLKMDRENRRYLQQEEEDLKKIEYLENNFFLDIREQVIVELPEITFITEEERQAREAESKKNNQKKEDEDKVPIAVPADTDIDVDVDIEPSAPPYHEVSGETNNNRSTLLLTYEKEKDDPFYTRMQQTDLIDDEPDEEWENVYEEADDFKEMPWVQDQNAETIRNFFDIDLR